MKEKEMKQTNIKELNSYLNSLDENEYNEFFQKQLENSEMEKCILCGKKTNVPKNLHIDFRDFYVEGAGQLCYECGKKINK